MKVNLNVQGTVKMQKTNIENENEYQNEYRTENFRCQVTPNEQ